MAEFKRNFSGAKMNKDMDERVLPSGQYRDANNIQVVTSDGSDMGSLQTLLGNTLVSGTNIDSAYAKCVGSIAVPEKNMIYYFVSQGGLSKHDRPDFQKDFIIEYNTITEATKFVFVDIFNVKATISTNNTQGTQNKYLDVTGGATWENGIRPGMLITGTLNDPTNSNSATLAESWGVEVTDVVYQGSNVWRVFYDHGNNYEATAGDTIRCISAPVLKFNPRYKIHSINYMHDMLFWTDGMNEPRKINIERSLRGTGGLGLLNGWTTTVNIASQTTANDQVITSAQNNSNFHTRLTKRRASTSSALKIATNRTETLPIWVREDHITVIKKGPPKPLELSMYVTPNRVNTSTDVENPVFATTTPTAFGDADGAFEVGHNMTVSFATEIDLRVGDTLIFVQESSNLNPSNWAADKAYVRAVVVDPLPNSANPPNTLSTGPFNIMINTVNSNAGSSTENWLCRVELEKPLFEYKFPRFSYRWKYEDGEYSTFAPWSEIAFLPGDFDYMPKKGFNLGMTNRLRYLKLKQYFPEFAALPEDVVEVDLLYKEAGKSTVYTVKSIKPKHGTPTWPDYKGNYKERGEFEITSEMIHAVVPSNQLLRPWDNVPRAADTMEISGNRLIYGNYLQNYNIDEDLKLQVTSMSTVIEESKFEDYEDPNLSIKSLRTYQVGVVWSDKYGRETPVMVPKIGGSITIPKKDCIFKNQLSAKIMETTVIPPWAEYVNYYVKETSNEYYNLAMDRFYDAEDGNIWLSFPSAERNKVQEDTYLYLKKQHDNATAVTDKARYRVIAIENEAPLFIKKKRRSFGFETVEFQSVGLPEEGRTFIRVSKSQFKANFGTVLGPPHLSDLQVRIGGIDGVNTLTSEIYQVAGIGEDGNWMKITLAEPLGVECAPISGLNAQTQMKLEIFQDVFEDKPEFDGRFFVKILKDLTLEKQLLTTFTDSFTYNVVETMQLGYLNNQRGSTSNKNDCDEWWCKWRDWHDGGSHTSTKNRWIIDDQDTLQNTNFNSHNINRGGAYNYPQQNGVGEPGAHGYLDISYCTYSDSDPESEGSKFTIPWDRLKVDGTLFRFKGDPAQVVYKILGSTGRLASSNNKGEYTGITGASNQNPGNYNQMNYSGTWQTADETTPPLMGGAGDHAWNWTGSGNNSTDTDNQRISLRLKLDKMLGSGPNHLFDDGTNGVEMAPMNRPDGTPILLGERYDGAIVAGTVNSVYYPEGHKHNWYPFTSDTGAQLNITNQLVLGTAYDGSHFHSVNPNYGDQMNLSPLYHSLYPSSSSKNTVNTGGSPDLHYCRHNITIEFLEPNISTAGGSDEKYSSNNPAIWETEPREDADVDIYYEASGKIPLDPDHKQNELLIPIGTRFRYPHFGPTYDEYEVVDINAIKGKPFLSEIDVAHVYSSSTGAAISPPNIQTVIPHDAFVFMTRYDHSVLAVYINNPGGAAAGQVKMIITTGRNSFNQVTNAYQPGRVPFKSPVRLGWFNCWSFGNGVESDRIRDDFNAPQIDNGVKASTTLATPYEEERRSSGLIWSGIFNSTSGINDLNQFIQAEPITKDLSPNYGPIKRLIARNTDTLAFCEDKVLRLLTNKDALYNADGNTNVTASNAVIGQATPIQGDYGMSDNPEALAVTPAAIFWCDAYRGQVLKLQGGSSIIPISDAGMKDWFNDSLVDVHDIVGSWDEKKDEYNISIGYSVSQVTTESRGRENGTYTNKKTLSWSEKIQGWTSFKSFDPEVANTLNNEYYTWKDGQMYKHHVETDQAGSAVTANYFYGNQHYSDVTILFNDDPGSVKSFNTLNYEGTQSKISQFQNISGYTDKEYYNLNAKTGWYLDSLTTDLQEVGEIEFKNKEGKWFGAIKGITTTLDNLDEREFSVQGLGNASTSNTGTPPTLHKVKFRPHTVSTSGTNWDSSADSTDWRIHPDSYFYDYNFWWERYSNADIDPSTPQKLRSDLGPSGHPSLPAITAAAEGIIDNLKDNGHGVFVYSGLDLNAADFSVPGGALTTTGSGNATVYKWTDDGSWNADPEVHWVSFENVGTAGDPNNTILFKAQHDQFDMPAADKLIRFDIDCSTTADPTGERPRNLCFIFNTYLQDQSSGNSSTYINLWDPTDVDDGGTNNLTINFNLVDWTNTNTQVTNWDASHPYLSSYQYEGVVPNGLTTRIMTRTWNTVPNSAGYYVVQPNGHGGQIIFDDHGTNQAYASCFTYNYTSEYHTTHPTLIKNTTVEVYYTPSNDPSLDPDPEDMCALNLCFLDNHEVQPLPPTTPVAKLLSSTTQFADPVTGTTQAILQNANASGQGNLIVQDVTRSKYWQKSDDSWQSGDVIENVYSVTGTQGSETMTLPAATTTLNQYRYWYTTTSGGSGLTHHTLSTGVPKAAAPATFYQQINVTNQFRFGDKTNTTRVPLLVDGFSLRTGSLTKGESRVIPVNTIYTCASSNTVAIDRNPTAADITGGERDITLQAQGASGATVLRVIPGDVDGMPGNSDLNGHQYKLTEDATHEKIVSGGGTNGDNHCAFSTADMNKAVVGMGVECPGILPSGTTVTGLNSPTNHLAFSNAFLKTFAAGVEFELLGAFKPNTVITQIAAVEGVSAYKNVTVSPAIIKAIPSGTVIAIDNGWRFSVDLKAEALPTETVTGSSESKVVSTVYNKEVRVSGHVRLTSAGSVSSDLTLEPNYLTIS